MNTMLHYFHDLREARIATGRRRIYNWISASVFLGVLIALAVSGTHIALIFAFICFDLIVDTAIVYSWVRRDALDA